MNWIRNFLLLAVAVCISCPGYSQNAAKVGGEFIPFDGMLAVVVHPSELMNSKATELYPWELLEAWSLDTFELSLENCEMMKLVVATPGPAGPAAALVIEMKDAFSIDDLSEMVIGDGEKIDVGGLECILIPDSPNVVIHQYDEKTIIVASGDYLERVVAVSGGNQNGELPRLASATGKAKHLTVLFAVEPVRAMVSGFAQMMANELPPNLQQFLSAPQKLDALLFRLNLDDSKNGMQVTLLAADEGAADDLHQMIVEGLTMARDMVMMQAMSELNDAEDDPIQAATIKYASRMGEMVIDGLTPKQEGRRITFSTGIPFAQNVALQGILAGALLPAVQTARFAAKRAASWNDLKQLGLGMHVYHDVYGKFPGPIRDEDGKALLSWRVAILPYIEQEALYGKFNLKEPWDSETNLPLVKAMPKIFSDSRVDLPEGKTVVQIPIGKGTIFEEGRDARIRDITDGTSNTIMIFQGSVDDAVEWTKPDAELDLDKAMKRMGDINGSFSAVLADGSIYDFARDLGEEQLKAMLTRNGRELVDLDF